MLQFGVNTFIKQDIFTCSSSLAHLRETVTVAVHVNIFILAFCVLFLSGCFDQDTDSKQEVKEPITKIPQEQASRAPAPKEQTAKVPEVVNKGCVELTRYSSITIGQRKAPTDNAVTIKPEELYKPMSEKEVKQLLAALKPVKLKNASGHRISAKPGELSKERMQVLVQDVTATLARIHIGETLKRLGNMPNPDPRAIAWGKGVAQAMDFCGQQRYAGLDIDPLVAVDQVAELVNTFRTELEESLFGDIMPDVPTGGDTGGGGTPPHGDVPP